MRRVLLCLILILPVSAHADEGSSDLLERGAQMLLEGLMREIEPALEDLQDFGDKVTPALRGFMAEMGPALDDLMGQIEDWSAYHPPEMLENGDIIIRRKIVTKDEDDIEI